jgi:CBS domain containing-hemolysin-like protein
MTLAASFGATDAGLLIAVIILIGFSMLLALAETGLVRTSKARAAALEDQGLHGSRSLRRLVAKPEGFLAPLLLLVLICQLVAATLVGVVASRLFGAAGIAVATVFEVVVIFVVGEAIPKNWAVRNPDRAALLTAPFVSAVIAFPPVRFFAATLIGLSHLLARSGGSASTEPEVTESELLALADVAVDEDVIEHEERALISSIIDFGDTIVREVMMPRPDMVAVEGSTPLDEVLERAMAARLSRLPVYRHDLDDVIGVAYALDVVRALRSGASDKPVAEFCRPAHFVPETKRVAPLLREMQLEHFHLAIVVDEYGVTAGIVTLEDLIEELVGEITDEFDVDSPTVEPLAHDAYRISATMTVDDASELLGVDLPNGDWDTVGGLVLHAVGGVPREGEVIEVPGARIVVERVQRHRVRSVRISVAPQSTDADEVDAVEHARDG